MRNLVREHRLTCWAWRGRAGEAGGRNSVSCFQREDSRLASHSSELLSLQTQGLFPPLPPSWDSRVWAPCQPAKSFLDPLQPCVLQTVPRPLSLDDSGADKPSVQKVQDQDLGEASDLSQPVSRPMGKPRSASADSGDSRNGPRRGLSGRQGALLPTSSSQPGAAADLTAVLHLWAQFTQMATRARCLKII